MLKEGDKAPNFTLESDEGGEVGLSELAKKDRTLVLFFYPKDSTPGCTREAQAFSAAKKAIEKAGGTVCGISRDSIASHKKFREKYGLTVTLLSDPTHEVHEAYGAWGEKTMYGKKIVGAIRSTFLIRNGRIEAVFPKVKVDGHVDEVLEALQASAKKK